MTWKQFKELLFQNFAPEAELNKIRRDFLGTHQTTESVHDFSMTFLDRAHFLPEYANDERLLMKHYVDMLRKDIRQFISARDWKNMDQLMNAALEREQETKKEEEIPPKRKMEQASSSRKKVKPNEAYPSTGVGVFHCVRIVKGITRGNAVQVAGPATVAVNLVTSVKIVQNQLRFAGNAMIQITRLSLVQMLDLLLHVNKNLGGIQTGEGRHLLLDLQEPLAFLIPKDHIDPQLVFIR